MCISCVAGTWCYQCNNAASNEDCNAEDEIVQCADEVKERILALSWLPWLYILFALSFFEHTRYSKLCNYSINVLLQELCEMREDFNSNSGSTQIKKGCKQKTACENNEQSHASACGDSPNSVCYSCCEGYLCNEELALTSGGKQR